MKSTSSNFWIESTLNSYSIILFSDNKLLALIIMLVTFMTPAIGLVGLCFILCFHVLLLILGFEKREIQSGVLGFNALLAGMFIANGYVLNSYFIGLFFISVLISMVIIIWCKNYFHKYGLPILTVPFFIIANIISLSAKNFDAFNVNMDFVFYENTIIRLQESNWYQLVHSLDTDFNIPNHFRIFLITLSSIFFQKTVLGGILVLVGIFIYSRIAVVYAFIGFYSAVFFYHIMGGSLDHIIYFYSGINFILMAIALGCYFYIPSVYTMILAFFLSPILMFITLTLGKIMVVFQMNPLSMSFSILTSITLYILHSRNAHKLIIPADISLNSPEKSLYSHLISLKTKMASTTHNISLPFWGEWKVTQGYDGTITHLGDWGKAIDFSIVDEDNRTYCDFGTRREDFYCFNKPILAPADGYIYDIINYVDDNEVKEVNVSQNWGNSIIMNHLNGIYTQMSHLKKDSFAVKIGDYVKKGTLIATCGNSGRSPEPHLHFQAQEIPVFGAKTTAIPISYFIENKEQKYKLKINEVPEEQTLISNVEVLPLLMNAFDFKPNIRLKIANENKKTEDIFEICTTELNELYFFCPKTNTKLFFINDGVLFFCKDFHGDTNSVLFDIYKSCNSILLGYYPAIKTKTYLPNYLFTNKIIQTINDFISPVMNLTEVLYNSQSFCTDNIINTRKVEIKSSVCTEFVGIKFNINKYSITILENGDIIVENKTANTTITARKIEKLYE